jgi:hypothetical protein
MAFISVTRLRARSLRFVPAIALHTWRSRRQLKGAAGFVGGYLATGPNWTFWTITVWEDEASMRGFRNASAHRRAMPALIDSCDEASLAHWTSPHSSIPSPSEAAERLKDGRTSKVGNPTPAHAAGNTWPDQRVPLKGPRLRASPVPHAQ